MMNSLRLDPGSFEEWGCARLLANGGGGAMRELCHRHKNSPAETLRSIRGNGLSSITRHLLTVNDLDDDALHQALDTYHLGELALVAKRQAALDELNRLSGEREVRPLLIKGAATSYESYPSPALRPSLDIDAILPPDLIARHFGDLPTVNQHGSGIHAPRMRIGGMALEFHNQLARGIGWGNYDDLTKTARPSGRWPNLLLPSKENAITICLLHFSRHIGQTSFDLIDLSFMLEKDGMNSMPQAWIEHHFAPLIYPGLLIHASLSLNKNEMELADELWTSMCPKEREMAAALAETCASTNPSTWRLFKAKCAVKQTSMIAEGIRQLFGNVGKTAGKTGMTPQNPLFWAHHLIILPMKRMAGILR